MLLRLPGTPGLKEVPAAGPAPVLVGLALPLLPLFGLLLSLVVLLLLLLSAALFPFFSGLEPAAWSPAGAAPVSRDPSLPPSDRAVLPVLLLLLLPSEAALPLPSAPPSSATLLLPSALPVLPPTGRSGGAGPAVPAWLLMLAPSCRLVVPASMASSTSTPTASTIKPRLGAPAAKPGLPGGRL